MYIQSHLTRGLRLAAAASVAALIGSSSTTRAAPVQQPALEPYALVDQWPSEPPAVDGLLKDPQGLDVDLDDRAFVSDRVVGGVVVMLPDGTTLPTIGTANVTGPGRLVSPGRLVVDQERKRLYVLDNGTDRVVVYDLDGTYLLDWNSPGLGIAVAPDGSVFVADGQANQIRVFGSDGSPRFTFGSLGLGNGEFTLLTDVSVSPDGKVAAVGDKNGLRVQLFDLSGAKATYRRDWDLQHQKYSQSEQGVELPPFYRCRSGTVFALGGDEAWVGDGSGSCWLRPDGFDYTIGSSMATGAVCKLTVKYPRVRPATAQYAAVATYNPNVGPCWSTRGKKDTQLDTTGAVLRFADDHMHRLTSVSLATDELPDGTLVGPSRIGMPAPGQVFLQDETTHGHLFGVDGAYVADAGRKDLWKAGRTERTELVLVEGSPVPGEIFAYYRKQNWGRTQQCTAAQWIEREHGIGRYRSVTTKVYGRDVLVAEPIWEKPWRTGHPVARDCAGNHIPDALFVVDIAYDAATSEVLALEFVEHDPSDVLRKPDEVQLVRFSADGVAPPRRIDLAATAFGSVLINTYSDLGVTPSGHAFVLDPAGSTVTVVAPDGRVAGTVPVASDSQRVAGGPDGTLFVLLRSGFVERRRVADGMVSARFDARWQTRSDPGSLQDLAVDAGGRVYVVDGLSNQVLVFGPTSTSTPRPSEDGTCGFTPAKSASPTQLRRLDTTRITLALDGYCSSGIEPTDIVIVGGGPYHELVDLLAGLDMTRHRVALVSVPGSVARLTAALTHDRRDIIRAAGLPQGGSGQQTGLPSGLKIAQQQFKLTDGRRHVVFIWNVEYCSRELTTGGCGNFKPAEQDAKDIAATGTQIVVDNNGVSGYIDAPILATRADGVIPPGADRIPYLLDFAVPDAVATNLTIVDGLPANMRLVPGSAQPPATIGGADLTWQFPTLAGDRVTFSFVLQPQQAGRWPTNTEAVATFTDGWGNPQRVVFPVPEVEVLDVEPTPTGVGATATAAVSMTPTVVTTPVATMTPDTPARRPVYLPLLFAQQTFTP